MHALRGRIGQYKILIQQQQLRPYVAGMERFSKQALCSMLQMGNQIILKPIVGMDFISVTKHQKTYQISTSSETTQVLEDDLYESIEQLIGNRNYVIQSQCLTTYPSQKSFHRLITVQKRHGYWQMTASSKQTSHVLETIAYFLYQNQLKKLALLAAEQLGPFYPHCESIVIELQFNIAGEIAITDSFLHFSVSKWNQYQSIAKFMPKTDLLTRANFNAYLKRYPLIFIKPCNGQQGKGVIKIYKRNRRSYEIHAGRQKWVILGIGQVYVHLRKHYPIEENHIIQQGMALATIERRFSDIRVMTEKAKNDWLVTGKVVKVAGTHFFITNAAQELLPLHQALKRSNVLPMFHRSLENRIDTICIAASKVLDEVTEREIIGFDVAVTKFGRLRIIEGNYVPDMALFKTSDKLSIYKSNVNNHRMYSLPKK